MLVLTRSEGEKIKIGDEIEITLVRMIGGKARIGIDAPLHQRIIRGEIEPHDQSDAMEWSI